MATTDEEQWNDDLMEVSYVCIFSAANLGLVSVIENLVNRQKCDLNAKNEGGWTPLMYAANCGRINVMDFLLNKGARRNLQNYEGRTALMLASSAGHVDAVNCLLKTDCLVNLCDKRDWLALFHAVENQHSDVIKRLLAAGADINYQEKKFGYTVLMIAAIEGNVNIVSLLLNHDADVSLRCFSRDTAQSLAVINGHINLARKMNETRDSTKISLTEKPAPANLRSILTGSGLAKFYQLFDEQEIDLQLFLTLTENDLFDIGIKHLGPRKKILYVIDRYLSNIPESGGLEQVHANRLCNAVKDLESQLEKAEKEISSLKSQLTSLQPKTNVNKPRKKSVY